MTVFQAMPGAREIAWRLLNEAVTLISLDFIASDADMGIATRKIFDHCSLRLSSSILFYRATLPHSAGRHIKGDTEHGYWHREMV